MTESNKMKRWCESGFFEKWTFAIAIPLLDKGATKTLELSDLTDIDDRDKATALLEIIEREYSQSKPFFFIPKLMITLLKVNSSDWFYIIIFTCLEGYIRISLPLLLILLLRALENGEVSKAYIWAAVMSFAGVSQTIIHHVLFFYSTRIGWNWKNGCTAL